MEKKILVTAAGGNQGKILIPKAAKAGFTVRAMRRSKDADELLAIGASEVVIGDASNPNDVARPWRASRPFIMSDPRPIRMKRRWA
jgi:uncharacterized protein YbjT (DUF2867 family)